MANYISIHKGTIIDSAITHVHASSQSWSDSATNALNLTAKSSSWDGNIVKTNSLTAKSGSW
jgi:hypothetical protein